MTNKQYIAEYTWGKASLSEVVVTKETDKTVSLDPTKTRRILGWLYHSNRERKSRDRLFPTQQAALQWLISQAQENLEQSKKEQERLIKEIAKLVAMVNGNDPR